MDRQVLGVFHSWKEWFSVAWAYCGLHNICPSHAFHVEEVWVIVESVWVSVESVWFPDLSLNDYWHTAS